MVVYFKRNQHGNSVVKSRLCNIFLAGNCVGNTIAELSIVTQYEKIGYSGVRPM